MRPVVFSRNLSQTKENVMSVHLDSSAPHVIPVIENSSLFEKVSCDRAKHETTYRLKAEKLSKDKCHIFFGFHNLRNWLVSIAVEFSLFHPLSQSCDKYKVSILEYKDSRVMMCSFPKEYAYVCQRAAELFEMKITHGDMHIRFSRKKVTRSDAPALTLADDFKKRMIFEEFEKEKSVPKGALAIPIKKHIETTFFHFPKADNILWVQGKSLTKKEFNKYKDSTFSFFNSVHELGVDVD